LKVLIIGLGSIGNKHVNALRQLNGNVQFTALRHRAISENTIGIKDVFSWEEAGREYDFIIISNPTAFHEDSIEKAIDKQLPLFIEKPVLMSVENAGTLVNKIKANSIMTYTGCNLRFHKTLILFKKLVGEKLATSVRLNEIMISTGSYLPEWRKKTDFRKSYSVNSELGGAFI